MLGEIFLLKFLTSLLGLFLSFTFVYLPIVLAIIAYFRKWGIRKFLKRLVKSITLIIITIILVIGVLGLLGNFVEIKDPTEKMVNNLKKYKNMPCKEIEIKDDKYCFDQGKVVIDRLYKNPDGSWSLWLYILSDILSKDEELKKNKEHLVRVILNYPSDEDSKRNESYVEAMSRGVFAYGRWDNKKDMELYMKKYQDLINNPKNEGKFIDITKYHKNPSRWSREYIFIKKRKILSLIRCDEPDKSSVFKFFATVEYQPIKQTNYVEFSYGSNKHENKEQFFQFTMDLAEEFNQLIQQSEMNNSNNNQ